MKLEDLVNDEMRRALEIDSALKAELPAQGPWDTAAYRRQYDASKAYWNRRGPVMAATRDVAIPHPRRDVPCRIHYPRRRPVAASPALIFFHGGGWVVGSLDTHDRMMRELAARSGYAVLGVDYPLAPEHGFADSYGAALHVVRTVLSDGAAYGLDTRRVGLAGDSAGAHMSLYCALQLKGSALPPVRALILIYGAFGLLDSASRRLYGEDEAFSQASMDYYVEALMGDGVDPATAGYDLLRCDLEGLPPSLITTCTLDLLRDDGIALAGLLTRAGVVNEVVDYDGVLHGYAHMCEHVSAAADTLARCATWAQAHV